MNNELSATNPVSLSPRQYQCIKLLAEGHTAISIAYQLGISQRMVRTHISIAKKKLGANSTAQAIVLAVKQGLLG